MNNLLKKEIDEKIDEEVTKQEIELITKKKIDKRGYLAMSSYIILLLITTAGIITILGDTFRFKFTIPKKYHEASRIILSISIMIVWLLLLIDQILRVQALNNKEKKIEKRLKNSLNK